MGYHFTSQARPSHRQIGVPVQILMSFFQSLEWRNSNHWRCEPGKICLCFFVLTYLYDFGRLWSDYLEIGMKPGSSQERSDVSAPCQDGPLEYWCSKLFQDLIVALTNAGFSPKNGSYSTRAGVIRKQGAFVQRAVIKDNLWKPSLTRLCSS